MTLLDFARGPGMQWALIIFFASVSWRLVGAMFFMARRDLSKPRRNKTIRDGLTVIATRSVPARQFEKKIHFQHLSGYAWHIALFISVLFFTPLILFFESFLGFGWPNLPNMIIISTAGIALVILSTLLVRRETHPVQRLISNADDYISVVLVIIPLLTGILASAHVGARYETLLAVHFLSVEAMFIWFPFGKLMHAVLTFPSRFQAGARYGRRGVNA